LIYNGLHVPQGSHKIRKSQKLSCPGTSYPSYIWTMHYSLVGGDAGVNEPTVLTAV
jgi:hypothetical protein